MVAGRGGRGLPERCFERVNLGRKLVEGDPCGQGRRRRARGHEISLHDGVAQRFGLGAVRLHLVGDLVLHRGTPLGVPADAASQAEGRPHERLEPHATPPWLDGV